MTYFQIAMWAPRAIHERCTLLDENIATDILRYDTVESANTRSNVKSGCAIYHVKAPSAFPPGQNRCSAIEGSIMESLANSLKLSEEYLVTKEYWQSEIDCDRL